MMDIQFPGTKSSFTLGTLYEQFPVSNGVGHIRLIQLLPGRGLEQIVCTMSSDCLDYRPHYTALSYVWGDSTVPHPISVNGMLFPVTSNLYSALTHLRDEQIQQTLWVDAICINQNDSEEKGHQVGQMIRVYEQADQVIAWLGESENDSDLAINYITSEAKDKYQAVYGHQRIEDALIKFWCRPYWTRVWVVQELAMARQAVFRCGF
jgi:Heterokaryon incompatibility protein (HET)